MNSKAYKLILDMIYKIQSQWLIYFPNNLLTRLPLMSSSSPAICLLQQACNYKHDENSKPSCTMYVYIQLQPNLHLKVLFPWTGNRENLKLADCFPRKWKMYLEFSSVFSAEPLTQTNNITSRNVNEEKKNLREISISETLFLPMKQYRLF